MMPTDITASQKNKKNQFTVSNTKQMTAAPQQYDGFRPDLMKTQQCAAVQMKEDQRREKWIRTQEGAAISLHPQDAAWCGKALLAEAIRYQYAHKSKRLTKVLLERCPLMESHQRRFEEDVAFDIEEHHRSLLIEKALARKFHCSLHELPTLEDQEAVEDARDELERRIDAPEVEAKDIVAPMAPELARMMFTDFDTMLGLAPTYATTSAQQQQSLLTQSLLQSRAGGKSDVAVVDVLPPAALTLAKTRRSDPPSGGPSSPLLSFEETKAKYSSTVSTFSQLHLWRVKRSKCKYQN